MPLEVSCPHCDTPHCLEDRLAGKKVRCKQCKQPFPVASEAGGEAPPAAAPAQAVWDRAPAAPRPAFRGSRADENPDDRPGRRRRDEGDADERDDRDAQPRRGRDRNGEDDRDDRPRRRNRDEDDRDNRDAQPRPAKKSKLLLILGLSIGLPLLILGGVFLIIFLLTPNIVDQKLDDLKSEEMEKRGEALTWLAEAEVKDDKRAKVLSTLEGLMEGGAPNLDHDALFRAYMHWGDKENISALAGLLEKPTVPFRIRSLALTALATADVPADQRAKLVATLEILIQTGGLNLDHDALARAYLRWVDKDKVPTLIGFLDKPSYPIWVPARVGWLIETLGRFQDDRAIEAIARKLPDFFVANQAVSALKQIGIKAENAVTTYAFHNDQGTRQRALELLSGYGVKAEAIAAAALERIQSPRPEVRNVVIGWFAENRPTDMKVRDEAAQALVKLLEDLSPQVREQALRALKLWATKTCLPQLVDYAKREEKAPFGNGILIEVLAQFKEESAAEAIALQLTNFHMRVQGKPTQALINMGPVAAKAVLKYINHPDRSIQKEAKKIYRLLKVPAASGDQIEQTIKDIAEGDKEQRRTALQQLANLKPSGASRGKVAKALNAALLDGNKEVVEDAVKAVRVWGTKENTEALVKILGPGQAQGPGRNEPIIAALGALKDPRAAKALAEGLVNFFERGKVSKALIEIGPEAEEAVLAHVIQAPDSATRIEACKVIGEIGTEKSLKPLDKVGKKLRGRDNNFFQAAVVAYAKIQARAQGAEKK